MKKLCIALLLIILSIIPYSAYFKLKAQSIPNIAISPYCKVVNDDNTVSFMFNYENNTGSDFTYDSSTFSTNVLSNFVALKQSLNRPLFSP